MVSDNIVQVYGLTEQYDNGIVTNYYITPRYCGEPPFTTEQEKAIHEMCRAFIIANRRKEAGRRAAEKRKQKRRKEKEKASEAFLQEEET